MAMGLGLGLGLGGRSRPVSQIQETSFEVVLQTELLEVHSETNEGAVIRAHVLPFLELAKAIQTDPDVMFRFAQHPDKFEEFIAACYERDGWERVTLTPRSGDGGRDIIAEKNGFGSLRVLDQCKAFSKGHLVGQNDVRAMLGVLAADNQASKAVISTTSQFAPGVHKDRSIRQYVPFRLELRDGALLSEWLKQIA